MNEINRIDNLLKLMRRGSWNLSGEEILAFHQCYEYLVKKRNDLGVPDEPVKSVPEVSTKKKKNT